MQLMFLDTQKSCFFYKIKKKYCIFCPHLLMSSSFIKNLEDDLNYITRFPGEYIITISQKFSQLVLLNCLHFAYSNLKGVQRLVRSEQSKSIQLLHTVCKSFIRRTYKTHTQLSPHCHIQRENKSEYGSECFTTLNKLHWICLSPALGISEKGHLTSGESC